MTIEDTDTNIFEIEKACIQTIDSNINLLVPWYLMTSYAYYVEDDPIISDSLFDRLGKKLLESWEEVEHFHKDYLNVDMLRAGTYSGEYPSRVKNAVEQIRKDYSDAK